MMTKIDDLAFEIKGDQIMLEQSWGGEVSRIAVHPIHLRHLAECLGLVSTVSASDAELLRNLARYKRALLMLRERAEQLHKNIFSLSQRGHEDMGIEVAQSAALADFAEHICIEFEDDFMALPQREEATDYLPVPAPDADKLRTTAGQSADKGKTGKTRPVQEDLTLERPQ